MLNKNKTVLIDIGNSSTQFMYLTDLEEFNTTTILTKDFTANFIEKEFVNSTCIVSCVVPAKQTLLSQLASSYFVSHQSKLTININIDRPTDLGADRIVNAEAAYAIYKQPVLIIDSGTALTFCFVDGSGVYHGGAIFPGLKISSQALNDYTAQIPLIYVEPMNSLFGKTTEKAVQAGLFHGFKHLINGMIGQYKAQYPDIKVVGTGTGLVEFQNDIHYDVFDENLIFKGLKYISQNNSV